MPVRRGSAGFYADGRPVALDWLPPETAALRVRAGGFFDSRPPGLPELWQAQAEQRMIAAQAAVAGLPFDAPPELAEIRAEDSEGNLKAVEEWRHATAALAEY